MLSIPTVQNFMNGDFLEITCPMCHGAAGLVDWHIRYTGQGAGQHCLFEGEWWCETCGDLLQEDIEIRWCWMINETTQDVTMIYPSDNMESEYAMLMNGGFHAATWKEVLAFELAREEAEYAFA